jgi:hypothetical protein
MGRRKPEDSTIAKLYVMCLDCDKKTYPSRRIAKQIVRRQRDQGFDVKGVGPYACPFGMGIHIGHSQGTQGRPNLNDPRLNHVEET